MGVSYEVFKHLSPKKLECFAKGHKLKIEEQDSLMHSWWGTYGLSALTVAIDHCFNGKSAKSEYMSTPIMENCSKKKPEEVLTEEEKKRQTEQLFMQLQIMGANHRLSNKEKYAKNG